MMIFFFRICSWNSCSLPNCTWTLDAKHNIIGLLRSQVRLQLQWVGDENLEEKHRLQGCYSLHLWNLWLTIRTAPNQQPTLGSWASYCTSSHHYCNGLKGASTNNVVPSQNRSAVNLFHIQQGQSKVWVWVWTEATTDAAGTVALFV